MKNRKIIIIKRKKNTVSNHKSVEDVKENLFKNIDKLINKLTDNEISYTKPNIKDLKPNFTHYMFNTILYSLITFLWKWIPEEREYYEKIATNIQDWIKSNPKKLCEMWQKSVEGKDNILLKNENTFFLPEYEVLNCLKLEENWNKLDLTKKAEFWTKLRQLQTLNDIMDIVPEEILSSLEDVSCGVMNIYGGTVIDKVTESLIQNDTMMYGIQKLTAKIERIFIHKLPTAPSYVNLLQKAENY